MEKIIYWLKKVGIMRSGVYTAKGDAKKIVEMEVDSELYQSDKEIEKEHEQKNNGKVSNKKDDKNIAGKITFGIFVVIGLFFLLAFWGGGWTFWTIIGLIMWSLFLRWMWVHITEGLFAIGKILVFGAIVIVASLIFASPEENSVENEQNMTKNGSKMSVESENKYLVEGVENDHIAKFLLILREETGINFSKIQNDDVVWTGGPGLQLQKAKSFGAEGLSPQDFDKLEKFFVGMGANDGGLGFTFVPPAGTQSSGFAMADVDNSGMMCVLIGVDNDGVMVGCGWGPTSNPNQDK